MFVLKTFKLQTSLWTFPHRFILSQHTVLLGNEEGLAKFQAYSVEVESIVVLGSRACPEVTRHSCHAVHPVVQQYTPETD
jgi:hypothetical protein